MEWFEGLKKVKKWNGMEWLEWVGQTGGYFLGHDRQLQKIFKSVT